MENIDVLCINCENMISFDKVQPHSQICQNPTNIIMSFSNSNALKQVNFRLDKLKCAIECIIQEKSKPLTPQEIQAFSLLLKVSTQALSLKEISQENIENCQNLLSHFSTLEKPSPCLLVYSERLRLMIGEKRDFMLSEKSILESTLNISEIIEQRAKEIENLNRKIKKFHQSSGELDGSTNYLEVNSVMDDLVSKRSSTSSMVSPKESKIFGSFTELDKMIEDQASFNQEKSIEDLQKFFYSKCLVMKLGFSSRDLAQFIQIPELYRKVKELELPVDKWEDFIKEQFKNPARWVVKK